MTLKLRPKNKRNILLMSLKNKILKIRMTTNSIFKNKPGRVIIGWSFKTANRLTDLRLTV